MSRVAARVAEQAPRRSTVQIGLLEADGGPAWDRFVLDHPEGTFYHLSGWARIWERTLGHRAYFLEARREGQVVGVLPLGHVRSLLFGNALISVPFLVYGGPLAEDDAVQEALLGEATTLAKELGVDYLELRGRRRYADWPVKSQYVTFRKAMDPDPEANLKAIPRKQRAMVRKGEQAGLEVSLDEDVSRLYPAMLECKRNLGTPFFSRKYLQAVKDTFGPDCEILTLGHQGRTVCSVMSFRFRNEILPYYGGGGDLARDLKGNDFMYWKVMERACLQGVEIFDYGRSTEGTGPYRFKKHWGFEPEPLYYQYYLVKAGAVPNLSPTNPRYRLFINAWRRLPLPVAGIVGPALARRLA